MPGVKVGSRFTAMARSEAKSSCCLPSVGKDARVSTPLAFDAGTGHTSAELIALDGGWFRMGADDGPHPEDGEGPAREVFVNPVSLAATAVTMTDFSDFVAATGYITLAERAGSSFVFFAFSDPDTAFPAPLHAPWWRQVLGACWNSPTGVGNPFETNGDHPVTHIASQDALAYCRWSGTRLPTEAEWEYAARGKLIGQPFPWGETLEQDGLHHANVWQGEFPEFNNRADGYEGTAPVASYQPNSLGFFNMTGNVWEWVSDQFTNLHSPRPTRNPYGPLNGPAFVAKGGSYLCHLSYCARYRTSSRQSLLADTTTGNLGFRVAALNE